MIERERADAADVATGPSDSCLRAFPSKHFPLSWPVSGLTSRNALPSHAVAQWREEAIGRMRSKRERAGCLPDMMTLVLPLRGQHTLAFLQELVRESADGAKTPCFPFNCAQENMRAGT